MIQYLFYTAILQNDLSLAFRIYTSIEKQEDISIEQMIEKLSRDLDINPL